MQKRKKNNIIFKGSRGQGCIFYLLSLYIWALKLSGCVCCHKAGICVTQSIRRQNETNNIPAKGKTGGFGPAEPWAEPQWRVQTAGPGAAGWLRPRAGQQPASWESAQTAVCKICPVTSLWFKSSYWQKGLGGCNIIKLMIVICSWPFNSIAVLRWRSLTGEKRRGQLIRGPTTASAQWLVPWESTPWLCAWWQCVPGASRPAAPWFHGWTASRRRGRRLPCTARVSWSFPSRRTSTSGRWTLEQTHKPHLRHLFEHSSTAVCFTHWAKTSKCPVS